MTDDSSPVPAPARAKSGRPPFHPTPEQRAMVLGLAAAGIPQHWICGRIPNPDTGLPIDRKTLRRAFREELAAGMAEANQAVAASLFEACMRGDVNAIKFWLTNRAPDDWKNRTESLHGGVAGSPIVIQAGTADAEI